MSHVVGVETEVRDATAVAAACGRLGLPAPVQGTTRLYSESVSGLAVQLPGWEFPVVCDLASGQIKYDNYGGQWGNLAEMDRFLQTYLVETARIEARKRGHTVTEQSLADGSIKLTIQVAGRCRMTTRIIEVLVSPQGKVQVETKGFTGASCRQASEFIERALGKRTSEQLTAEFYQIQTTQQHQQEQT